MADIAINTTAAKIETMANKIIDNSPVENSNNLITSGAVFTGLSEKVDKIEGKGLSTNDYTTADKEKLSGIEAEANKTIIDTDLSRTSTNPIQNKAIYKYVLNNIPYITEWMSNPIAIDTIIFVRLYLSNQVVFRVKSSDTFTVEGTVYSFNEGILCLTSEDNGGNIIATNFSSLGNIKILTGTEPIATGIFSVTHYPPYTNDDKTLVDTVTNKADTTDVLTKTNTTEFTPTADYQPATKKYVDDNTEKETIITTVINTPIFTNQPTYSGTIADDFDTTGADFYFVNKLTDDTFNLMLLYNNTATVVGGTFTLTGLNTGNSGLLKNNYGVEFNSDGQMRLLDFISINIPINKSVKRIEIDTSGAYSKSSYVNITFSNITGVIPTFAYSGVGGYNGQLVLSPAIPLDKYKIVTLYSNFLLNGKTIDLSYSNQCVSCTDENYNSVSSRAVQSTNSGFMKANDGSDLGNYIGEIGIRQSFRNGTKITVKYWEA